MNDWSMLKKLIWLRIIKGGGSALRTVTGAIVHVTNALALPAEALTVNVEPIQAGSGDPSPDNVRPISGRTSATVTRCGKNLLNPLTQRETSGGLTFSVDDALIINGTSTGTIYTGGVITKENARYKLPAGTYTLSFITSPTDTNASYVNVELFSADGTRIQKNVYGGSKVPQTFTLEEPHVWDWWMAIGAGTYNNFSVKFQLENGSAATAYEPYQGNTYTIQLSDTVYGGTLDVTGGKMVVDRAIYDFGTGVVAPVNGSEDARSQGLFSAYGFTPPVARVTDISAVTAPDGIICNQFVAAPNNAFLAPGRSPAEPSFSQYATSFYVQWNGLAGKTNADAKAILTGTQIAAPLDTPFEITLTPTQIDMLLGENNLWSDAGDLTLTYQEE